MNNNNRIFLLFLLTISMLILSCSKQKDYNADNNFLAYYNTFYSAKQNFDNAVEIIPSGMFRCVGFHAQNYAWKPFNGFENQEHIQTGFKQSEGKQFPINIGNYNIMADQMLRTPHLK